MSVLQKIKDYLEESHQRNELVNPETFVELINSWESEDEPYQD